MDFLAFLFSFSAVAFGSPGGVVPDSESGSRGVQSPSNGREMSEHLILFICFLLMLELIYPGIWLRLYF